MKRFAVSMSALLLVGAVASPAVAGHDRVPSERVQKYVYDLGEVADNDPLGAPTGTAKLMALPNGKVQVTVEASGLAPGLPHAQHLHVPVVDDTFVRGQCPGIDADGNGDGFVDTLEGAPAYGGVVQSLTTSGDTSGASALAVDRFPVADEDGTLSYTRTFTPTDGRVHDQLGEVEVVVHGVDINGDGAYDFESGVSSLNGDLPLEATIPAVCGGPNG